MTSTINPSVGAFLTSQDDPSQSGSSRITTITAAVGGVACACVIALGVYLFMHRRRIRREAEEKDRDFGNLESAWDVPLTPPSSDFEKDRTFARWSPHRNSEGRWTPQLPSAALSRNAPQIPKDTISQSRWSIRLPGPPLTPNRPVITVITNLPKADAIDPVVPHPMERAPTPKTPKTPKWKLKRVPVPRLSKLPPTPVMLARSRSWLASPRRSFTRKEKPAVVVGLPSSVRPIRRDQIVTLPPGSLAVPLHSCEPTAPPRAWTWTIDSETMSEPRAI